MDLDKNLTSRVLYAVPECVPLTKTGGLGDVAGALPAALRAMGIDARVLLPAYGALPGREVASVELLGKKARILESNLPAGVPLYLLDCPELYIRNGGPYQTGDGKDWPDNALRFGVLSVPLFYAARVVTDWRRLWVSRRELSLTHAGLAACLPMAAALRLVDVIGMVRAFSKGPVAGGWGGWQWPAGQRTV